MPDFHDAVVKDVMATLPSPKLLQARLALRYRVGVLQRGSEMIGEQRKAAEEHRQRESIEAERRLVVDGDYVRAFELGKLPASIVTDWTAPLLDGDLPLDVSIDIEPLYLGWAKLQLDARRNALESSAPTPGRQVALVQIAGAADGLRAPSHAADAHNVQRGGPSAIPRHARAP